MDLFKGLGYQGELNLDHCPETCIEIGYFSEFSEYVIPLEGPEQGMTHGRCTINSCWLIYNELRNERTRG